MRGGDTQNQMVFSDVRPDDHIPSADPPRLIHQIADSTTPHHNPAASRNTASNATDGADSN